MIHNNKVLSDARGQMGNGFVQTHSVESAFFRIRKQSFHIFQRAGHFCLAVSLQHRNINPEIHLVYDIRKIQLQTPAVSRVKGQLFCVLKLHAIVLRKLPVPAIFQGFRCFISHPGSLCHDQMGKAVFLQILQNSRNDLRMCRSSKIRRSRTHQIGLNADAQISV